MSTQNGAPEGATYMLVRYSDGTEALVLQRVGDLVAFELKHGRPMDTGRVSDVLWSVWRGLGEPDDLQTWADRVISFSTDDDEVAEARARLRDPTSVPAGGGSSPA